MCSSDLDVTDTVGGCPVRGMPRLYAVRKGGGATRFRPSVLTEGAEMIETREPVVTEAIAIIDKALAEMLRRELVSATEVADLLLDLRSLLSANA